MITNNCYDLTPQEWRKAYLEKPVNTTIKEFQDAVRKLGLKSGEKVVVHSALSGLGNFEGRAEGFCRALMELVTPEGVLMMPSLTKYPKDGEEYLFDWRETPTSTGIATEVFRRLPGVIRSLDPTHSFAVWGKDNLSYVRNHHKLPTMHRDSPTGLLEQAGGHALLVSCMDSLTFMHVVETSCQAPCLGSRTEVYPARLPDGRIVKLRGWGWRKGPCRGLRHNEIFNFMREQGTLHESMLHHSHLMFFALKDYRTAYERLLLAETNGCADCPIRPRQIKQTVPSDWDLENDSLIPSEAFTGDVDLNS